MLHMHMKFLFVYNTKRSSLHASAVASEGNVPTKVKEGSAGSWLISRGLFIPFISDCRGRICAWRRDSMKEEELKQYNNSTM